MTARLWEFAKEADFIADLHTNGIDAIPYVIASREDEQALSMAKAFGTDLLLSAENDRYDLGLLEVATEHCIPTITAVIGHYDQIALLNPMTAVE